MNIYFEDDGVLGRDLIFQPVLVSLHYTKACTYQSDTTITLEIKMKLTLLILFKGKQQQKRESEKKEEIYSK